MTVDPKGFKSKKTLKDKFILLFIKFKKIIINDYEEQTNTYLEQSLFITLSLVILLVCGPLLLFSTFLYLSVGSKIIACIPVLSYLLLVIMIFNKRIEISTKIFLTILILYSFSIIILLTTAVNGAGLVCVLAIMFLSGIVLKQRRLFQLIIFNLLVFVVITILLFSGVFDESIMATYKKTWLINMLTTQMLGIALMILMNIIYSTLDKRNHELKAAKEVFIQSEKELFVAQENFKILYEDAPLPYQSLDQEGNLIQVNSEWIEMFGYKKKEAIGKWFGDFIHPDFISSFKTDVKQFKAKKSIFTEYDMLKKDGESIRIQIYCKIGHNEDENFNQIHCIILDVTEHQKMLEVLRRQEEEQRLLLKQLQVGTIVQTPDEIIIDCNFIAEEIHGITLEEMKKPNALDNATTLYNEKGEKLPKAKYPISILKETQGLLENYIVGIKTKKNKNLRWLRVNGYPIVEDGQIQRIVISFIDITDNIKNQQAIKSSEKKHKAMISNISDVIGILGADGKIAYKSENITKHFGWEPEDLIGKESLYTVHSDDKKRIESEYIDLLKYRNSTKELEYRYICKDGSSKYIQLFAKNMIDNTVINGILVNYKDITEKKNLINNYEMVIKTTMDGFCLVDDLGRFLDVNEAYCNLLGYSKDEFLTMEIADIEPYESKDDVCNRLRDIKENGRHVFETKHIHKNGQLIDVEVNNENLKESNLFFIFVHDLSRRKELEKERIRLESEMRNQQKLESIGTLASGVAHEINNPINGILNYGQIIIDSGCEDDEIKECAVEIINETQRVSLIVKNLLNFSRRDTKSYSKAQAKDIVENTLSLIQTIVKHDQIILETNIERNLPSINCRSQQIQQVLMNLMTNARDALNEKYDGYDENKRLIVSFKRIDDCIQIIVEDHGLGIPNEIVDKIFDPFFTTKGRDKGTGLGLSISYSIINEHNGKLYFETKEGEYTKFFIELPIKLK